MPPPLYLGLGLRQRQPPLVSVPLRPGLDPPPSRVSSSGSRPPPLSVPRRRITTKINGFRLFSYRGIQNFRLRRAKQLHLIAPSLPPDTGAAGANEIFAPERPRKLRLVLPFSTTDFGSPGPPPLSVVRLGPPPLSALSVRWRDDPPWSRYLF